MKVWDQDRRHAPFYCAALAGAVAVPLSLWLTPAIAVSGSANVFFLTYLVLSAFKLPKLDAAFLRKHAAGADEPVAIIFCVTFGAVLVAVSALFLLLSDDGAPNGLHLALSLASVALGWMTIHAMAAFHYAHLYWRPQDSSETTTNSKKVSTSKQREERGGLEFPGTPEPEGYDFLYFSFVIGMTAQTSDVEITSTGLRKLNLLHAVVSFLFNTVLVAAAVNVAVSLAS